MPDHASSDRSREERDIELSDVRLLDEQGTDDSEIFSQSNLTSVLANPDFARKRCSSNVCGSLPLALTLQL